MKKIDAQRKYKELFDDNVKLRMELANAFDEDNEIEIEDIAGKYVVLLDKALDTISKLIITGVQDGAN